jgi:hypothetical protein
MDIPSLTTIDVDSYLINIYYTIDIPKTASKFQHLFIATSSCHLQADLGLDCAFTEDFSIHW